MRRGLAGTVWVFPHPAGLDQLGLIVSVEGLQLLGASLSSKCLNSGQRREGRLLCSSLKGWEGLLISWNETELTLLLREQVIRDHWHLKVGFSSRISWRWILDGGSRRVGKGLGLRFRENVRAGIGKSWCSRIDWAVLAGLDRTAQRGALRGGRW